jgi:predicted nuclease of predicted toxin-antitoxin system
VHRVLVDEDLPRSLAPYLRSDGVDATAVRDVGLRSAPDDTVFAHGQTERRTIVSADLGFSNVLRFPLGSHSGVLVVRYPNAVSAQVVNGAVADALRNVTETDIVGALLIVEPGRVRMLRRAERA